MTWAQLGCCGFLLSEDWLQVMNPQSVFFFFFSTLQLGVRQSNTNTHTHTHVCVPEHKSKTRILTKQFHYFFVTRLNWIEEIEIFSPSLLFFISRGMTFLKWRNKCNQKLRLVKSSGCQVAKTPEHSANIAVSVQIACVNVCIEFISKPTYWMPCYKYIFSFCFSRIT